ncbi:hypothetical protein CFK37_15125 [Virgibacillus phasianinus]|uniref:YqfQ-like protein n=1 Tax=Virgibacillus phasianinus TaxID=2017483 RepID=A0A220U522_9BACI|nr:VrrA/YqfQ family protein [Virgibacillus phasianinus]ASK63394.1 hypothetical protein CFK37_15125 [Virgibacillus phasianinus]
MFPMNNRPPVQERQIYDPFSIRPYHANRYPAPKPRTSIPASIASFLNPSSGGLNKTLANVQKVMNMAESAAPMIKEYGPMVKNLPAMLKMMKALNASDTDDSETDDSEVESFNTAEEHPIAASEPVHKTKRTNEPKTRQSKPKLFI